MGEEVVLRKSPMALPLASGGVPPVCSIYFLFILWDFRWRIAWQQLLTSRPKSAASGTEPRRKCCVLASLTSFLPEAAPDFMFWHLPSFHMEESTFVCVIRKTCVVACDGEHFCMQALTSLKCIPRRSYFLENSVIKLGKSQYLHKAYSERQEKQQALLPFSQGDLLREFVLDVDGVTALSERIDLLYSEGE